MEFTPVVGGIPDSFELSSGFQSTGFLFLQTLQSRLNYMGRIMHHRFLGNCPPTPSLSQHLTFTSHLRQNVGLGEGQVGIFPETYIMIPLSHQFSYCIIKEVCLILCAQDLSRIEVKIQSVESPTSLSGNFFVPITEDKERCRSPELLYPPIANIAEVFNVFVTTL